uniref:SPX domain-containing protein n=1 Tax=Attheya septentrionalis TaxID=420275 RepID=A0A7S2XKP1_9STRA|mmetsp:Transcript_17128/g.30963  ORF Transcript_17128/g.30963 Transcript_17128/m.30963 type:complete len:1576 (+) Transcript_17128:356-5083(+)|eukprot:CAMPEP_0198297690 /NCGR_PEP_ID=MMETSP1449-20131203/37801_1 /TAXON_ID=420275 /ORGANISM="Attheya septentrionalis, Strain CCMP2084" /LENGTH=1575 /DNA_ID=CAMNT_0043998713 /DNA_START=285 /DNA_END=5012 /DNA_ORIENTATION=+
MVGFGSSLRLSRRPGWESAYLDYESLKLLLTQIEAVYEETNLQQTKSSNDFMEFEEHAGLSGNSTRTDSSKAKQMTDYRDELFTEDDSDDAFSLNDSSEKDDFDPGNNQNQTSNYCCCGFRCCCCYNNHNDRSTTSSLAEDEDHLIQGSSLGPKKLVPLPEDVDYREGAKSAYPSEVVVLSSEEDPSYTSFGGTTNATANNNVDADAPGGWRRGFRNPRSFFSRSTASTNNSVSSSMGQHARQTRGVGGTVSLDISGGVNDSFFLGNESLIQNGDDGYDVDGYVGYDHNRDKQHGLSPGRAENTSIQESSFYNFATRSLGDEQATMGQDSWRGEALMTASPKLQFGTSFNTLDTTIKKNNIRSSSNMHSSPDNTNRRRKRGRLKRRKRKRAPFHMRMAHYKARAITERFLGLLRAEVEKLTLFAHSRMGELADTIGSLRFPSYDDNEYGSHSSSGDARGGNTFNHTFSDGGMHPSSSSSEDEGASQAWSVSTDEESNGKGRSVDNTSPRMRVFSSRDRGIGGTMDASPRIAERITESPGGTRRKKRKPDGNDRVRRKLQNSEQFRKNRPIFQRNDYIVGEDSLLLSVVEEADAYTAVGVELLHLLRFICVNLIAVRKICKKHDRLLANRMMGGYYHHKHRAHLRSLGIVHRSWLPNFRVRDRTAIYTQDGQKAAFGGIMSVLLTEEEEPDLIEEYGRNNYKLCGIYDSKVQRLANSLNVKTIASSLVLALTEYEVSRSRANALSRLNTDATPQRAGSSKNGNLDEERKKDGYDGLRSKPRWVGREYSSSRFCIASPMTRRDLNRLFLDSAHSREMSDGEDSIDTCLNYNDEQDDAPSTSSSVSLTRLRFVVASIFGLQEAARTKQFPFMTFLSRMSTTFSGPHVVGEGLDGCSRETLNFFVKYNPDLALLLDSDSLHRCLQVGNKWGRGIGGVMLSTLAAGSSPHLSNSAERGKGSLSTDHKFDRNVVLNALSIMPSDVEANGQHRDAYQMKLAQERGYVKNFVDSATLQLNRYSMLLYTINYYVIVPSATAFTLLVGTRSAHSASLIGASSVSAIVSNLFHSWLLSRNCIGIRIIDGHKIFKAPLIFAALFPLLGNLLYAHGAHHSSIEMAICGRFLIGFGSAEVLNRQILANFVSPIRLVPETAKFVKCSQTGLSIGLLLGTLLGITTMDITLWGHRFYMDSLTAPSYVMAVLWLMQLIGLLYFFQDPAKHNNERGKVAADHDPGTGETNDTPTAYWLERNQEDGYDSDTTAMSDHAGVTPDVAYYGALSSVTEQESKPTLGSTIEVSQLMQSKKKTRRSSSSDDEVDSKTHLMTPPEKPRRRKSIWLSLLKRIINLIFQSVALPGAIAVLAIVKIVHEVLLSSCAIIAHRYFGWDGMGGVFAGLLLAALASLVLPTTYLVEVIANHYNERTVIKRSLVIMMMGLLVMVNYEALLSLVYDSKLIFDDQLHVDDDDAPGIRTAPQGYGWEIGMYQYVVGFSIVFICCVALESSALVLISKIAPPKLCSSPVINCGSIVTFVGLIAQLVGDLQILFVGLSHRIINTDFINSLVFPIICACFVAHYVIKKHFFFLI